MKSVTLAIDLANAETGRMPAKSANAGSLSM
jgi:hypothetical protein